MKNLPIGEFLKDAGYITDDQINVALEAQKKRSDQAAWGTSD